MKLYFALDVETTGLNYDGSDIAKNRYFKLLIKFLMKIWKYFTKVLIISKIK